MAENESLHETRGAPEQDRRLNAVLVHLAQAWVTPFRFRTFGVREFVAHPAQVFAVLTSREVTWTLLIATTLFGIAPLIWSLLLFQEKLLFWIGMSLTPFSVTYLGVSLAYIWVVFSNLLGKKPPVRLLYPAAIFLASGAVSFVGFNYMEFLPVVLTGLYVPEAPQVSFVIALSFPIIFLVASVLVHAFVLNHVIPVGGERWNQLGERAASLHKKTPKNQRKQLPRIGGNRFIAIGDNDIPARSIRYVEAQGNYVRLLTSDGELMIRQPFSKVIDLLPNTRGVQLHRSRWVAFDAITDVAEKHDGLFVAVEGAPKVRVARSREECVFKALASAGVLQ